MAAGIFIMVKAVKQLGTGDAKYFPPHPPLMVRSAIDHAGERAEIEEASGYPSPIHELGRCFEQSMSAALTAKGAVDKQMFRRHLHGSGKW